MMRITRISSRGRTKSGKAILDYLNATEYYIGKDGQQHETARWLGGAAASLSLGGNKVEMDDMMALAKGFAPAGAPNAGDPLCQGAGDEPTWKPKIGRDGKVMLNKDGSPKGVWEGGHRVGFDLTFSAEKSVSLLFAAADPVEKERIVDAHRRAVARTMEMVEQDVESRRGKGGKQVIGCKIVASGHTHFGSRGVDGQIEDPQLHEHVLVYGVCQGNDGKWGTYDAKSIYEEQRMFGALYRAELAKEIQGLGYGIEKRPELDDEGKATGTVYFRVAGISDELCDRFSKRRKQVVEYAEQHGVSKNTAALQSRASKEEPPLPELLAVWKETLDGIKEMPRTQDLLGLPSRTEGISDHDAMAKLHEGEAVWRRADLIQRLAEENVGRLGADGVVKEADRLLGEAELYRIEPQKEPGKDKAPADGPRRFTEQRYASKEWVDGVERALLDSVDARKDDKRVRLTTEQATAAIAATEAAKGFELLPEQRHAVQHILADTGGTAILAGRAGTGKTTTLDAVVRGYKAEGRKVIACATAWNAAENLATETGMKESYAVRQLLFDLSRPEGDEKRVAFDKDTVVVLDEASMTGSRDVKDVTVACHAAGGKVVFTGDGEQTQAVEAGGAFRMLQDRIGFAELKTIRRQRDDADVKTAEMFYTDSKPGERTWQEQRGSGVAIFNRLDARNQIDHCETKQEAIDDLVGEYLASSTPTEEKIVIAGTNADVVLLNDAIRKGLQEKGEISPDGRKVQTLDHGKSAEIWLAHGDRIRFGAKDREMGVVGGTKAKVIAVAEDGKTLEAIITSGRYKDQGVLVDLTRYKKISYDYAGTVHRSQGQTRDECYQLATTGMTDRHLSLVAATRHRNQYRLYGSEDDLEEIGERMGMDRYKANALEEGIAERQAEPKRETIQVDLDKVARLRGGKERERAEL